LLFLLELIDNNIREKREKKRNFKKRAVFKIFRGFLTRRAPLLRPPDSCAVLPDPPAFLLEHGTKPGFSLIFQGLMLFHENLLLEQSWNTAIYFLIFQGFALFHAVFSRCFLAT
jgi:hypothetical protein